MMQFLLIISDNSKQLFLKKWLDNWALAATFNPDDDRVFCT